MSLRPMRIPLLALALWLSGCFGPSRSEPLVLRGVPATVLETPEGVRLEYKRFSDEPAMLRVGETEGLADWRLAQYSGRGARVPFLKEVHFNHRKGIQIAAPSEFGVPDSQRLAETLLAFRASLRGETVVSKFLVSWARFDVLDSSPRPPVRSWLLAVTYPIWGLPRDLVDAPFTMLRRGGFDDERALKDDLEPPMLVAFFATLAGTTVAAPVIALSVISPLWVAIPAAVVAIPVGAYVGIVAAVSFSMAAGPVFRNAVNPLQNQLLRGGVDSEDLCPNWRFGVFDRSDTAIMRRPHMVGDSHWVITEIRRVP